MQANTHVRDISTLRITDAEEAQPKLIERPSGLPSRSASIRRQ